MYVGIKDFILHTECAINRIWGYHNINARKFIDDFSMIYEYFNVKMKELSQNIII